MNKQHIKFVLVNGRTPRPQSFCALCCEAIGESCLRELTTRLSYCDHQCYAGNCKVATLALKSMQGPHDNHRRFEVPGTNGPRPSRVVGCAGAKCQNSFALANGFAVEAIVGEKFSIAFFCSAGCYLNEIPSNCLARA
jgi:hypothetical protein